MSTEATEVVVDLKNITADLQQGLKNAELNTNENGPVVADLASPKPMLDLGAPLIKILCRAKNGVQFRLVTKNLSDDIKEKLQRFNAVEDKEVGIYKKALDQYGSEHLSPELVQMINKYANSPLAPLIEFEMEKFNLMKAEVKLLQMDDKKGGGE